jgi:hypothetical protein
MTAMSKVPVDMAGAPAATTVQVPRESGTLQACCGPSHGVLQHTPSTQLPDWHWVGSVQSAPFGLPEQDGGGSPPPLSLQDGRPPHAPGPMSQGTPGMPQQTVACAATQVAASGN